MNRKIISNPLKEVWFEGNEDWLENLISKVKTSFYKVRDMSP
jgi:hypothetical protein